MAVDIATLHIEVRADGVQQTSTQLETFVKQGEKAERSAGKLGSSFDKLNGYIKAAAAALGAYKLAEWAKDAALLSARYDTLGAAMNVVGNNAGYTSRQMAEYQAKLQATGIAMVEARESMTKMASAHIDLAKSSELARVAQDAAVIAGTNSSDAFARMTQGIQSGEVEILKTLGLNVNFQASYESIAQTLCKTADQLSENEKVAARTNAVLQKGTDIAGAYAAAMGTAGKQISSMQRYMDNLKVTVGSVFSDALLVAVESFTGGLKEANSEAEKLQQSEMKKWGQDLATALAYVIDGFRGLFAIAATVFDTMKSGFSQVYDLGTAVSKMIRLDLSGAMESLGSATTTAKEYSERLQKRFAETVDNSAVVKNQEMLAARLARAEKDAAKQAELEQQRVNASMERTQREFLESEKKLEAEHSESLLKIQRQRNDEALTIQDAADQLALDNLTASHQQGLVSVSDYLDQKYEIEKSAIERSMKAAQEELNAQLSIIEQLKNNPYADKDALAKKEAQYSAAKTSYQLQAISLSRLENEALNERVRLLGVEAEHARSANLIQEQFSIRQAEINALKESGATEELFNQQKNLDLDKLRFEYAEKMLDYQKQLNTATQAEAAILRQNIALYQQMFTASEAAVESRTYAATSAAVSAGATGGSGATSTTNWSGMDGVRYTIDAGPDIFGGLAKRLERERAAADDATAESAKAAAEAATAAAEAAEEAQRQWEEYRAAVTSLNNDLAIRALNLEGLEYEADLLKLRIAQQKELNEAQEAGLDTARLIQIQQAEYNELLKEQALDKHADMLAKVTKSTKTFFDVLKTSISELTSTGNSMVASLRNAATSLRQAAGGMSVGAQSNLSPEKQYEISRQNLASTVQRAMATGDADLYSTIPALVSSFLDTSRTYNASNKQYSSDFAWAKDILNASATASDYAASHAQNVITAMAKQQATLDAIKAALRDDNTAALPRLLEEMSSDNGALNSAVAATNKALSDTGAIATRFTTSFAADSPLVKANGNIAVSIDKTSGVLTYTRQSIDGINVTLGVAGDTISAPFIASGAVPTSLRSIGTTNAAAITGSGTTVSGAVSANGTAVSAAIGGNTTAMTGVGTSVNASAAKVSGAVTTNGSAVSTSLASTGTAVSTALSANGTTVSGGVKASGATISTGLAGNGKAVSDSLAASGSAITGSVAANGVNVSASVAGVKTAISPIPGALSGVGSTVSGAVAGVPGAITTAGNTVAAPFRTGASVPAALAGVGNTIARPFAAGGTIPTSLSGVGAVISAPFGATGAVSTRLSGIGSSVASSVGGVKTAITPISGAITGVGTSVTATGTKISGSVTANGTAVSTSVGGVKTAVTAIPGSLSGVGGTVSAALGANGTAVSAAVAGNGTTVSAAIGGVKTSIGTIPGALSGVGSTVSGAVAGVPGAITTAGNTVAKPFATGGTIPTSLSGVGVTVSTAIDGNGDVVSGAVGGVNDTLATVSPALSGVGSAISTPFAAGGAVPVSLSGIGKTISVPFGSGGSFFTALGGVGTTVAGSVSGIPGAISTSGASVAGSVSDASTAITGNGAAVTSSLGNVRTTLGTIPTSLSGVAVKVSSSVSDVGSAVGANGTAVSSAIQASGTTFSSAVGNVNTTLASSLSGVGATVSGSVSGIPGAITGAGATIAAPFGEDGAIFWALNENGEVVAAQFATGGGVPVALRGIGSTVAAPFGASGTISARLSGIGASVSGAVTTAGSTVSAPFGTAGAITTSLNGVKTSLLPVPTALTGIGTKVSASVSGVGTSVTESGTKISSAVVTNGTAVSTSVGANGATVSAPFGTGGSFTSALGGVGSSVSGSVSGIGGVITANGAAVSGAVSGAASAIGGVPAAVTSAGATISAPFSTAGSFTAAMQGVGSTVTGSVSGIPGAISTAGASAASSINMAGGANASYISAAVGKVATAATGTTEAVGAVNASVGVGNNSLAATVAGLGGVNASVGTTNESFADAIARLVSINSGVGGVNTSIGGVNASLGTVNTSLGTVNTSVGVGNNSLAATVAGLGTVDTSIGTTNSSFTTAISSLGTVNTSVGGVTTGVTAGTNSLAEWLKKVNSTTSTVNTAVAGVQTAVAPLVDISTNTSTTATRVSPISTISTNTGTAVTRADTTNSKLSESLTHLSNTVKNLANIYSRAVSIDGKTGKIKSTSTTVYPSLNSEQTIYTYYAKGGIANRPSIFGEAGPEAAVPLPDGRSIPVTITQPADNYRLDMSELVAEVRELRKENEELKRAVVGKLTDIESPLRRVAAR